MPVFKAILVLADISGYTRFVVLNRSSMIHAEQIVTELMEVITANATHPLKIEKLEGDAVFLYAEVDGDETAAVNDVCLQVRRFMDLYRAKQKELFDRSVGGCMCSACRAIETLNLKCVVHMGDVIEKQVGGRTELAGEPVILAHRLLKNSVQEDSYVLTTANVAQHLAAPPYENQSVVAEDIDEIGTVPVTIFFPDAQTMDRAGVRSLSRVPAIVEAARLFWRSYARRQRTQDKPFHHLPD